MAQTPDDRSVFFVTTPTSGSGSLLRVLRALDPKLKQKEAVDGQFEPHGRLYLARGSHQVKNTVYDERFRYVINFRDPRDMLCNQYYWLSEHPAPDEETKKRRIDRYNLGIDNHVATTKDDGTFRHIISFVGKPNVLFVSYAQLCCDFDFMVERLVSFLGVTPNEASWAAIRQESPEGVAANPKWIGQDWAGCDTMPGRYKRELTSETISTLDRRWGATLRTLRELEPVHLRHFYDVAEADA